MNKSQLVSMKMRLLNNAEKSSMKYKEDLLTYFCFQWTYLSILFGTIKIAGLKNWLHLKYPLVHWHTVIKQSTNE